jgi:secreted trypsin-like serine protease
MLLRNTTVAFFFFLLSRIEDTTNALNNQFAPFLRGSDVNLESLLDGDISPKVIGGIDVSNNVYPWFTRLFYSNNGTDKPRHCGGMLVTPFFVLTAAHCVNSSMKTNGVVVIGALSNDEDNGNQHSERILVKNAFVHPEYNYINIDKDFALLQLRERSSITPVDMDNSALSEKYSTGKNKLSLIVSICVL